jgi:hypothetical protein
MHSSQKLAGKSLSSIGVGVFLDRPSVALGNAVLAMFVRGARLNVDARGEELLHQVVGDELACVVHPDRPKRLATGPTVLDIILDVLRS